MSEANSNQEFVFNSVEEAIEDIRNGKIVIVVDDPSRENEGDFIIASQFVTPDVINFMSKFGRGLICVALTEERCRELQLTPMYPSSSALHSTAFTVSVDLKGRGVTTGISAYDRARTIQHLISKDAKPEDFARPGHVFPLMAKPGGVLRRPGHTEAAVDLATLAGLYPSGTLVEIMGENGEMAKLPELFKISQKFNLKIITIAALIKYRIAKEKLIEKTNKVTLPTIYGDFELYGYKEILTGEVHLALKMGEFKEDEPVFVRVHSSCVTGDIFGSLRCDCGAQLASALEFIAKEGKGLLVYMQQEGRGIGTLAKLKAYHLQETANMDTVEANIYLGFKPDERDYGVGAQIIRDMNVRKIKLLTNNPSKRNALEGFGLEIVETVPIQIPPNKYNINYLLTKKIKLGHFLEINNYINL